MLGNIPPGPVDILDEKIQCKALHVLMFTSHIIDTVTAHQTIVTPMPS